VYAHPASAEDVLDEPVRVQLEVFVDEHRRRSIAAWTGCPRHLYLHVLRELAQHCGHADILREQLMTE
jgi:Protein of unknown function (DUF664)